MENKAKREAQRAKEEQIKQATINAVSQMSQQTNAIINWETKLSKGDAYRLEPILTIELERLWLQQRPILFIGSIKDITTHNQKQYVVEMERSLLSSLNLMFSTELRLSVLSDKEKVDAFIKKYPDLFENFGFNNGVAVVARIKSIRTTYVAGEDGGRQEVKIGDGELIDIKYVGNMPF